MSIQPISGGLGVAPGQSPPPATAGVTPPADNGSASANALTVDIAQPRQSLLVDKSAQHDPAAMRAAVRDAVQRANDTVQVLRSNLQFTVDEATGIDVVKFIDIKTKEVIRQIPSEEMLALARRLDELKGLLIKDKA